MLSNSEHDPCVKFRGIPDRNLSLLVKPLVRIFAEKMYDLPKGSRERPRKVNEQNPTNPPTYYATAVHATNQAIKFNILCCPRNITSNNNSIPGSANNSEVILNKIVFCLAN